MIRNPATFFAAALVTSGYTAAMTVLAQAPTPPSPPPQDLDLEKGLGMMTMDPDHMKQMTRMTENCNGMTERAQESKPGSRGAPSPAKRD